MLFLEKMAPRTITGANYITSVNGMIHPDRILPEHDFLYILDGSWEVLEDGETYELHKDDLLILAAGRHHYGQKYCNPGNRHMYFHVLPTPDESARNKASSLSPAKPDSFCFPCNTLVHCQHDPLVRQYFQELIAAFWSEDPEKKNRLYLLFNLLLCEFSKLSSCTGDAPHPDAMIEEIGHQIRSNPQIFYSAQEIADSYFICPRTLNNRLKKLCGKTFYTFQMDIKLEMVRQFLMYQPDAKLREVAVNFGFCDEFHLSKIFKKHFGQPPSKFRGERDHAFPIIP